MEVVSRIESVVVYARGARVRRVATVTGPIPAKVRLVGLPLAVMDDTVRSEVDGPATVHAARVAEDVGADAEHEEPPELRAARRRVTLAETDAERIGRSIDQLAAAPIVAEDPSEEAPAPWAAMVAARRQLIAMRGEREVALREQLSAARRELDAAQRAFEVAGERDARSGSARGAKLHEPRKYVELELAAKGEGAITIHLEYQVLAARWAPSYIARLDGEVVKFELRAVVAQDSGEDWQGISMRLSTAEPTRFAELPELSAQKIGRRQHEPAKKGFRSAPTGADELYRDYDAAFPRRIVETAFARDDSMYEGRAPTAEPELDGAAKDQVWDEETSNALVEKARFGTPQQAAPVFAVAPGAMPARAKSGGIASAIGGALAAPLGMIARRDAPGDAGGGRAAFKKPVPAEPLPPVPRLDYGALVMAAPSMRDRGHLVPAPRRAGESGARVAAGVAAIDQLALPPGHANALDHVYDYAFATDGVVDVKADAAWHSIALTARSGTAKLRHVAVPREQPDVFRVAAISNPLDGPLLPGPIDVYDRGQFLVTSEVDYTPPGGTVEVGLGVDAQVKIARNVEYHEEATGVLRGGLRLVHAIAVDVENLGTRPIDVEVRERVPVADDNDDDIEVTLGKVEPAWERWTPDPSAPKDDRLRGAYRWRLALPPATKRTVRATYEIKIAGKHELVGGNRREP